MISKFKGWCLPALATAGVFAAGCGDDGNNAKDAGTPKDSSADAFVQQNASLTISPLTSAFGTVTVGSSATPATFTVTNAGPGASDQVQVNLSGNADYHIASNTCATLAVGATCAIGVNYMPTAPGDSTATLQVGATGTTATAMISGTGGKIGNLSVSPSTFSFANATVGTPGTDMDTITVTNTGGQTTGSLTVQAVGSDPTQFTKSGDTCNGMTLTAGATCTITVKFAPTTAGTKNAGFTIIGAPGGMATAQVTGLAATAAQLAISPMTQSFGSVVQGTTSSTVAINVANIGGSPTGALTAGITGTDASSFAIVTNTCTSVLAGAGNCQLTLRYTPSALGAASATLTVAGTPGGSVTTALGGTGITAGGLKIDPTTQTFAATQVGATSTAATFTVTNSGGTAIGPVVVNFTGGDASQFRDVGGADTCTTATLQPAGTCTFQISFSPASVGTKTASVIVSAGGSSVTSALSGAGTPAPQLAITPNSRDFGSNGVGTTSAPLTFTVTNVGGAPTTVPMVALSGANMNQFAQTNNCAMALAPLGTCTISVTFSPTSIASDTATITASAATGGSVSANLFGQGTNPAQLSVLPGNLSFSTTIGDPTTQTFTVQNNGSTTTGALTVAIAGGGIGAADFTQTNTCAMVPAGGTCTVTVTYTPTVLSAAATATVSGTPGGSATVALAGTAVPRIQVLVPNKNPYDFGDEFVGAYISQIVTIRNNTNTTQTVSEVHNLDTDGSYPAGSWYFPNSCQGPLGAGLSCSEIMYFTPASVGPKKASIVYTIGAGPANRTELDFKGNGLPSIQITAESTNDFGNVTINKTSPTLHFKVQNLATLQSVGTPIANAINAPFNVTQGTCNAPLAPLGFGGSSCDLDVTFSPTTLGPFVSTLTVTSNPGGSDQIDVHGTGVDASNLQLTPSSADFGTIASGGTPVVKTFVLQNPAGSQTSGTLAITLTGASEYSLLTGDSADCPNNGVGTLANGLTCNVRVQYAPTDEVGTNLTQNSQLTIKATPGATGSGLSASLTGKTSSAITITPTTYNFGSLVAGNNATKSFTVTNASGAAVTFVAPTFTGTATDLSISANTCTGTLAAAGTCSVTVKFAPAGADSDSATLVVAVADGKGNADVAITASSTSTDGVLYDQTANWNGNAYGSQSVNNTEIAVDFLVPAGGWVVSAVQPRFAILTGQSGAFNVSIYNDNAGLPGTLVASFPSSTYTVAATFGDPFGGYTGTDAKISFTPTALATGRYWISAQWTGASSAFWYTTSSAVLDNSAIRSPSFCSSASFVSELTCEGVNDHLFSLIGHAGSTFAGKPQSAAVQPLVATPVAPVVGRSTTLPFGSNSIRAVTRR